METRAKGAGGLRPSMLEHVGNADNFRGHEHKGSSTKNPLGRCLQDVLGEEEIDLLKVYLKKRTTKRSGYTEPESRFLGKYNENTRAIVATLVGVARGDLLRQIMEAPPGDLKPSQIAALTNTASRTWLEAVKILFDYTALKPQPVRGEGDEAPIAEILVLRPDVPEVALPLPETARDDH